MRQVLEVINLAINAENFIGNQFSFLQRNGDYKMHLICSPGEGICEFASKQGVRLKLVRIERQISLWSDIKAFFTICQYIRNNRIDIIIGHQAKGTLLAMIAGWIMRVPIRIIFAHGILSETMNGIKRRVIELEGAFCSLLATNIICVSRFVKEYGSNRYNDKKVVLGYGSCTGIDTFEKFCPDKVNNSIVTKLKQQIGISDSDFVVGYCGRIVKDKGIIELVEAIQILKNKYPNRSIHLLIVGPEEIRDAIPARTLHILKQSQYVHFTGFIPYSQIQYYYLLMNVLVLASHREGLGLVSLEAQAMRIPAIVSNYTGCRETLIDGETGFYTDGSPSSIAQQLEKCFDQSLMKSMGENGRAFVIDRFEETKVHTSMLNYLNSLI